MQNSKFKAVRGKVPVRALALGLGMLYPLQLAAQTATADAPPAPAANPAAASPDQIEDVVINARKRTENIQEVPAAITYVGRDQLQRDDVNNINTLTSTLPSLSLYTSNPKQTNIGVRGIGNVGANADGIDPSVGVFIDGVYAGRIGETTNDFSDLESIVMLRGPQGTLFGKNTIGGALLINTQKPSFTPGAEFETSQGSYNLQEYKANVTGAAIDDAVALRLAAYYRHQDGTTTNLYDGSLYDEHQGQGVRGQVLFTPSADLTVRLILSHDSQEYNVPVGVPSVILPGVTAVKYNAATGACSGGNLVIRYQACGAGVVPLVASSPFDRQVDFNTRQYSTTDTTQFTGQVDWDIGYGTITSITGIRNWLFRPRNDNDATQLNAITLFGGTNSVQTGTQELRWASPKGSEFDTVVGLYFFDQKLASNTQTWYNSKYYAIYAGQSTPYSNGAAYWSKYNINDNSEAVFAHTVWHATDHLDVNAGLRWTNELKTIGFQGYGLNGTTPAQVALITSTTLGAYAGPIFSKAKDASPGGELGLSYKVTDDALTYISYSHGSVAKGVQAPPLVAGSAALAAGATQVIDAENADSIEIGAKTDWFQHRLVLNGDLYNEWVSNYQTNGSVAYVTAAGSPSTATFLTNVGSIITQGVEVELTAKPIPNLLITGWGSYDNAYFSSFPDGPCPPLTAVAGQVCNLTGRAVPYTPRWSTDLKAEYDHDLGEGITGYVVADYNWRSSQNVSLSLDPWSNIKAYGLVNLRAGARLLNEKLDVSLFVNNALNTNYLVNSTASSTTRLVTQTPGAPLVVGATLRARF